MKEHILTDSRTISDLIGALNVERLKNEALEREVLALRKTIALMQEHEASIDRQRTAIAIERNKD